MLRRNVQKLVRQVTEKKRVTAPFYKGHPSISPFGTQLRTNSRKLFHLCHKPAYRSSYRHMAFQRYKDSFEELRLLSQFEGQSRQQEQEGSIFSWVHRELTAQIAHVGFYFFQDASILRVLKSASNELRHGFCFRLFETASRHSWSAKSNTRSHKR